MVEYHVMVTMLEMGNSCGVEVDQDAYFPPVETCPRIAGLKFTPIR